MVSFQWLEGKIREIGWFILDPSRKEWPPKQLRNESTEKLFTKIERHFLQALPKCGLDREHEENVERAGDTALAYIPVRELLGSG